MTSVVIGVLRYLIEFWIREDEEKITIGRLKDDIVMPIRYERLSYDNIRSPLLLGFRRYALKRNNFGCD